MKRAGVGLAAALSCVAGVALGGPTREPPEASRAQVANAVSAVSAALAQLSGPSRAATPGTLEDAIRHYVPSTVHAVDEGGIPAKGAGSCPPDMAKVAGAYCVDRYEGSLVERRADGTEVEVSPYGPLAPGRVVVARSVAGVVPTGYVSAAEAEAACRNAKKRLCSPLEWRIACAGSKGNAYPYGPTRASGKCHDSGKSPMLTYHADTMSRGWGMTELNDPRANALEGGLEKTGASPACVNDYGLFDMVGNLHEWTSDPNGTFQGGYWLDTTLHGEGCAYRTVAHGYTYHDYSTGFRCCADLTP